MSTPWDHLLGLLKGAAAPAPNQFWAIISEHFDHALNPSVPPVAARQAARRVIAFFRAMAALLTIQDRPTKEVVQYYYTIFETLREKSGITSWAELALTNIHTDQIDEVYHAALDLIAGFNRSNIPVFQKHVAHYGKLSCDELAQESQETTSRVLELHRRLLPRHPYRFFSRSRD